MQLPTYYKEVLPQVQSGSGVVRQQAVVDPGEYISVAEQQGIQGGIRRTALNRAVGADIYGSVMELATVVAAGIGAASNLSASEAAKAAVAGGSAALPADSIVGEAAKSGNISLPKDSMIAESAGKAVVKDASWAKSEAKQLFDMDVSLEDLRPEYTQRAASFADVVKAMASTAFPEVSNAFQRGRAMTAGNSTVVARGMSRQLEDRVSIDREITQMMRTESPEAYDERIQEIFDNQMMAAKEELPPEAYQAYYQQMMSYRGNKELSVASTAGQKMYDDQKALQNSMLEAAILNGNLEEIDNVIVAGMTGYGNNPISVYTEAEAQKLAVESYKKVERNKIRQDLAEMGTTNAVDALRARDDSGNYVFKPGIPLEERREYVKELIGIEDTELRRKRKVSQDIEESVMAREQDFLNGRANFRDVMDEAGPGLLGYERASLESWYRSLMGDDGDEMSAATNSALFNISMQYGSGEMSIDDAKAAISPMLENGDLTYSQSVSFVNSLKSDDSTIRRKPTEVAKRLAEDYDDVTAVDEDKLAVSLSELMRTDEYKTAGEDAKSKMEINVAEQVLGGGDATSFWDFIKPESRDAGYKDPSDRAQTISTQGFSAAKTIWGDAGSVAEEAQVQALNADFMGTGFTANADTIEALKGNLLSFAEEEFGPVENPEESLILYNGAWLLQYNGELYFAEPQEYGVLNKNAVELVKYEDRSKDWPAFEYSSEPKNGKVVPPTRYGGEVITKGHFIRNNGTPQSLSREHTEWVEFRKNENFRLANPRGTNEWYLVNGEELTVNPITSLSQAVSGQYDLDGTLVDVTSFDDYQVLLRSRNAREYYENVGPSDRSRPRL